MKTSLLTALLLTFALGLGTGAASAALVIRFSHVVTQDAPKGLAALRFKELVERRSGNRIQVQVYPASSLYGDHDEMLALQIGAVEIIAPALSKFAKLGFPSFELFDLPFLFRNFEEVRLVTQGEVGLGLLRQLGRQQIVGLGYMDNGFKHMSANRPLLAPADYRGLRMRIQPSKVISSQMQALGAHPLPLAFNETRTALARKVADGTENPLSNFITQRMNEVQTDLSLTNHGYLGYAFITSQRFWKALSENDRVLLQQAMDDALEYGNQVSAEEEARSLAAIRAAGTTRIHVPSDAQREALKAAMQPVYEASRARIGTQLLDRVLADIAAHRARD